MLFHPIFGKVLGEILEKWSKWIVDLSPFSPKKGGIVQCCSMVVQLKKWIVDLSPMGGVIFFKVDAKILKEVLYG